MLNGIPVIAGGTEYNSLNRDLYQFYYSIKNKKYRYGIPFDFMEYQKWSKTPLYDEQYTLFAIAFLDNTLDCSPVERLLLGIGALYSLELLMNKPYFGENTPYYLEVSRNLESLLSQFTWEEIYRICNMKFREMDVVRMLSRYRVDNYLK